LKRYTQKTHQWFQRGQLKKYTQIHTSDSRAFWHMFTVLFIDTYTKNNRQLWRLFSTGIFFSAPKEKFLLSGAKNFPWWCALHFSVISSDLKKYNQVNNVTGKKIKNKNSIRDHWTLVKFKKS
jgi:hypothetical protein